MEKLWEIDLANSKLKENPGQILRQYAEKLHEDSDGEFYGVVTENIGEDTGEITYALYIQVPKLKNYMYRLIEVNITNLEDPFPIEIKLLAKHPKNHTQFYANDLEDYKHKLKAAIKNPVTKNILTHLHKLIEIKRDYS